MLYEAIILKKPYREDPSRLITSDGTLLITSDGKVLYASGEVVESRLKKDIAARVRCFEPNDVYKIVADLPVEHYLTTNYDNTLLKAKKNGSIKSWNKQEQLYSIRRHYSIEEGSLKQTYWPIHGSEDSPGSIMIGFDHYCGALNKIENFVKGGYESSEQGRMASIIKRLQDGIQVPLSWIDLFFISDIHIIGQGLDYSEMDLWWILNKRRRIKQKEDKLITNNISYYPDCPLDAGKRQLLSGFGITICDLDEYSMADRESVYLTQLNNMRSRMK